jgi:hypothetical protein
MFMHTVYFWLKEGLSDTDRAEFLRGVTSLTTIDSVRQRHVGVPAPTDREVIDRTYSYALVVAFEDQAAHDRYQEHPVHDAFRGTCERFWRKVQIYDSLSVE